MCFACFDKQIPPSAYPTKRSLVLPGPRRAPFRTTILSGLPASSLDARIKPALVLSTSGRSNQEGQRLLIGGLRAGAKSCILSAPRFLNGRWVPLSRCIVIE